MELTKEQIAERFPRIERDLEVEETQGLLDTIAARDARIETLETFFAEARATMWRFLTPNPTTGRYKRVTAEETDWYLQFQIRLRAALDQPAGEKEVRDPNDFTVRMGELRRIAENLARSLGHATDCPKISGAVPCKCGAAAQQAEALTEYERWKTPNVAREKEGGK